MEKILFTGLPVICRDRKKGGRRANDSSNGRGMKGGGRAPSFIHPSLDFIRFKGPKVASRSRNV